MAASTRSAKAATRLRSLLSRASSCRCVAPYPGDDQAAEAARLQTLGATLVDVGQGDVLWKVLADPEGNEFCILAPR